VSYLSFRKWGDYQHYRDRDPIWIKFYVRILDDHELSALPVTTQLLFDRLLLLAGRNANVIRNDPEALARLIGITPRECREGIVQLVKGRWIRETRTTRRASKPATKHASNLARPEKELEEEREGKGRKVESSSKNGVLQTEDAVIDIAKEAKISLLVAMIQGEEPVRMADRDKVRLLGGRATLASLEKVYESATNVRMENPNAYILSALADENAMVRAARRAKVSA
jgi:hypothetical protein